MLTQLPRLLDREKTKVVIKKWASCGLVLLPHRNCEWRVNKNANMAQSRRRLSEVVSPLTEMASTIKSRATRETVQGRFHTKEFGSINRLGEL